MITSNSLWAVAGAVVILANGQAARAAKPWRVVDQPELKQALENATALRTESLGEPARGVNTWEHWPVPNPDGKTWDELQIYFKEYYGPTWLYAVDLGTGQVKTQRLPDNHQFFLSGRALGFDGKYYIVTPRRGAPGGLFMFVYDPATNTMDERGQIVPDIGGEVRPIAVGPDGRIYGTGSRDDGKLGLYVYDPKLRNVVKNFGGVGPRHPNGAWSRYEMGVDDTHAYIASGMIPSWYLLAVNLETGEAKVLLESPTERRMDVINTFPGARVIVPQSGGVSDKEYWLYHGQAIPKVNDTPPWPRLESPWDKAGPKPEIYRGQVDPDAGGKAALWYRLPEDKSRTDAKEKASRGSSTSAKPEDLGWRKVSLKVEMYSHRISALALLPDGRLFSAGEDYVGSFIFDPKSGLLTLLGRNQGIAAYTHIVLGNKLYSSGYPGGPLYVFDPKLPWTVYKGGPPGHPAPDRTALASNPRELGSLARDTRVAIAHCSALGADGKIYFGGFGERNCTGGGFGWYAPETGQLGGFWEPLSGYAVQWIAPALGARFIVVSTSRASDESNNHRAPEAAKLFFYDVNQARIVREIVPIPKGRTTGLIMEVGPGRLLGLTVATVDPGKPGAAVLYGLDVATGEVLFSKTLPSVLTIDGYWPHWLDPSYEHLDLLRGPDDEFVWTYLKNVLVRIDPKDATLHVVGKIDPPGMPIFVGYDLYFSGPEQLRRIRNIVPVR